MREAARSSTSPILAGLQFGGLTVAEQKALAITSTLETGRRGGFYGLTGNFDGMGLSFGLLNWNLGAGSLQPLLRDFLRRFPARWKAVFGDDAARFAQVIADERDGAKQAQTAFAIREMNQRSQQQGKTSWTINPRWTAHFRRLSEDVEFQAIQVAVARGLFDRAEYFCRYFSLISERAFCFMFDAVSSHGPWWLTRKDAATGKQRRRELLRAKLQALTTRAAGGKIAERAILQAVAETLGETSRSEYRARALARKLWFLTGKHARAAELTGLEPTDAPYTRSTGTTGATGTVGSAGATPPQQRELAGGARRVCSSCGLRVEA